MDRRLINLVLVVREIVIDVAMVVVLIVRVIFVVRILGFSVLGLLFQSALKTGEDREEGLQNLKVTPLLTFKKSFRLSQLV